MAHGAARAVDSGREACRRPAAPHLDRRALLTGGIGSLAGQLGISFNADPSQSPRFYASVAKSRELLERILVSQYPDPRQEGTGSVADSATLLRILGVHGRDAADSLHRGVKKLRRRVIAPPSRTLLPRSTAAAVAIPDRLSGERASAASLSSFSTSALPRACVP